jgi:hypothetical protein
MRRRRRGRRGGGGGGGEEEEVCFVVSCKKRLCKLHSHFFKQSKFITLVLGSGKDILL